MGKSTKTGRMIGLALGAFALGATAFGAEAQPTGGRTVMNLVNFVRGCEPRVQMDLVTPLAEEIKLNTKYGFPNTILLQYDALLRDDIMAAAMTADRAKTEYGVWIEIPRQLVEAVGIAWRGRKGWDWDWFVNPGFLESYTHEERKAIIDELFRLFREKFGYFPASVGSWVMDAWSIGYMKDRYDIKAVCVCREEDVTDAYGLRGGYSNGAYYPSRKNMLSAAADMKNAVKVPVFKMLTPDPIYNYGYKYEYLDTKTGRTRRHCVTLEPAGMGKFDWVLDWYFRVYTERRGLLNLSYMQTGQENSFGWKEHGVAIGYPKQLEALKHYAERGLIEVETLGDTGRRFLADHDRNCPQTNIALEDWSGKGIRSAWYNCGNYRANVYYEGSKLYIRDIHRMCDDFEEDYLNAASRCWQELLFTPPVVDGYMFATNGASGMLAFDGDWLGFDVESKGRDTLVVTAHRTDYLTATVRLDERGITVEGAKRLTMEMNEEWRKAHVFKPGTVELTFKGFPYRFGYTGKLTPTEKGYFLEPENGRIELDLTR